MRQQINLYQPAKAEHGKLFTAATTASALGVITVLLLLIYGYGLHAVTKLASDVDAARQQQQRQTTLLAGGADNAPHAVDLGTLQAQLKTTNATLIEHRRALQLLHVGAAGGDKGFSERLTAMARQHIEGVWLDHIVLGSNAGVDNLSGNTIDAELIPRYLHKLATEPALVGTRFNEFSIDGKGTVIDAAADDIASDTAASGKDNLRTHIQFHAGNKTTASNIAAESIENKIPPIMAGSS